MELNKINIKLTTDNKNLLLANSISKEKREDLEKKYKDATDRNSALIVINNNITQFTNHHIPDK